MSYNCISYQALSYNLFASWSTASFSCSSNQFLDTKWDAVRKIVRSCLKSFCGSPSIGTQIIWNLPVIRVIPSCPSSNIEIDYAGPFMFKERNHKNIKSFKSYISICFSTCTVHLELVSDLSTSTFLAAQKIFVAHRGKQADQWLSTKFQGCK